MDDKRKKEKPSAAKQVGADRARNAKQPQEGLPTQNVQGARIPDQGGRRERSSR
ncbi:hypothetical protein [Arenimonas sp.]|uniref:hypothetical protein n=1 Tax=Arenimonas sp. TaxID=1872635 RepID=UPI0039E2947F